MNAQAITGQESAAFIRALLAAIDEDPRLTDAGVSVAAGLNRRAVTDIRDGRVRSPKLSTVFALAHVLGRDPGEMMGLGPRQVVQRDLAAFLSGYGPDDHRQFLDVLEAVTRRRA